MLRTTRPDTVRIMSHIAIVFDATRFFAARWARVLNRQTDARRASHVMAPPKIGRWPRPR